MCSCQNPFIREQRAPTESRTTWSLNYYTRLVRKLVRNGFLPSSDSWTWRTYSKWCVNGKLWQRELKSSTNCLWTLKQINVKLRGVGYWLKYFPVWGIKQHGLVVSYRIFGTPYWTQHDPLSVPLKMELIGPSRNVATIYQFTLRNPLHAKISFTPWQKSEITHTDWLFNRRLVRPAGLCPDTKIMIESKVILDFKLSPCSVCCMFSSG